MNQKTVAVFVFSVLLTLVAFCGSAAAYDPSSNMNVKWKYALPFTGRSFAVADMDGDGSQEVIVGLHNNTLLILSSEGELKSSFSIGNMSKIGKTYALAAGDTDGDGKSELLVGLGGLKISETFQLYAFEGPNATSGDTGDIVWKDSVLYRSIRYRGALYQVDSEGNLLWKKPTYNSVLNIDIADVHGDGFNEIVVGVGDYGVDIYSELADINYTNKSCTEEYIEDEYYPYDEEDCTCDGCVWHSELDPPECLRSYVDETCVEIVTTVPGRMLVEYPLKNGSVFIHDRNGELTWGKNIIKYLESQAYVDTDADNNVRVVHSADVNNDGLMDILVGVDAGTLYVFNLSGITLWEYETTGGVTAVHVASFNETTNNVILGSNNGVLEFLNSKGELQWMARLRKSVESIEVSDIDSDGVQEILAGSGDGKMYVYDSDGINEWYYPTGDAIYYLKSLDIDGNGYMEVIVGSLKNVTMYEMNIEYVLRQSAQSFYDKAEEHFSLADYTVAMIYITKAKDIYFEIKDVEGITRSDVLIKKINDELQTRKKFEADVQYDRALAAYARSDLDSSLAFIEAARRIYLEIGDELGLGKCDSLKNEIEKFVIAEKSVKADSHYSWALNYFSFRNYTRALDEARTARDIYQEIGYYNGTLLVNRLIVTIGDSYYADAQIELTLSRFNTSLAYANAAMELYNETKSYDGTAKTELLIQEINKKMLEDPFDFNVMDYGVILYAVLGIFIVVVILKLLPRKKDFKSLKVSEPKEPETSEERYDF